MCSYQKRTFSKTILCHLTGERPQSSSSVMTMDVLCSPSNCAGWNCLALQPGRASPTLDDSARIPNSFLKGEEYLKNQTPELPSGA